MEINQWICSAKQLDIKADGPHEQIDVAKTLTRHLGWKSLAHRDRFHDAIPESWSAGGDTADSADSGVGRTGTEEEKRQDVLDGHDQTLLLLRAGAEAYCGQELPHVRVLAGVDRSRKDGAEDRFEGVEQPAVDRSPKRVCADQPTAASIDFARQG